MIAFGDVLLELIVVSGVTCFGSVSAKAVNDKRLQLHPNETTSFVGDSVILYCTKEIDAPTPVDWYHIPVGNKNKIHIYKSALNELYITESGVNYQKYMSVDYNNSTGEYNLLIRNVSKAYAGTYFCVDTAVQQATEKTELIVIDSPPTCQTNVSGEGALGENSCNIPPDYIEFNCSINYHGNVAPVLELYYTTLRGNATSIKSASKLIRYDNETLSDVILARSELNGQFFHCRFKNIFQYSHLNKNSYGCHSLPIKIIHAVSKESHDFAGKEGVTSCVVDTNSQCKYKWMHQMESRYIIIRHRDLLNNDSTLLGSYQCLAECNFYGVSCSLKGQLVEFFPTWAKWSENEFKSAWVIVAGVFVCLFVILIMVLVLLLFICKFNQRNKRISFFQFLLWKIRSAVLAPPQGPLIAREMMDGGVELVWNLPENYDQLPLKHYLIQKKQLGKSDWETVDEIKNFKYEVKTLEEGKPYNFRVIAHYQWWSWSECSLGNDWTTGVEHCETPNESACIARVGWLRRTFLESSGNIMEDKYKIKA